MTCVDGDARQRVARALAAVLCVALFVLRCSARPGIAHARRDAGRDEALDGRAADEGGGGSVLHRVRSARPHDNGVSGRLGAIVENPPRRTRTLRVEVRVGDYTFDSSRFVVQGFGGGAGLSGETVIAPLDDDYDAMRREIWLTTDAAYKRAVTMFARKKAAFQNRTASDPHSRFLAGTAGRDDCPWRPARH